MRMDEGIDLRPGAADSPDRVSTGEGDRPHANAARDGRNVRDRIASLFFRGDLSASCVVRAGELMASLTTLRVGGPADWYVEPAEERDVEVVARRCRERGVPLLMLGRGSNLLVRDGGFRGVVMALRPPAFCRVEVEGARVHCGAGALLRAVAGAACERGVGGFEFMEGIPGTVGGALRTNAGAFGSQTFEVLETVCYLDGEGVVVERPARDLEAVYRDGRRLAGAIALRAVLRGHAALPDSIRVRMEEFRRRRRATQPREWSAGCVFKNTDRGAAGWLIDRAGLKGLKVGGAAVSKVHANFLVNEGEATAAEMIELIRQVRERVHHVWGIELKMEVEIVGEEA